MPYLFCSYKKGAFTLEPKRYGIGQFAAAACVSLRTLRYYDTVGLLSPTGRTPAGYRQYSERDLMTLQQILALKRHWQEITGVIKVIQIAHSPLTIAR